MWVTTYIQNGFDAVNAVQIAYPRIKTDNARWQMSHKLRNNDDVMKEVNTRMQSVLDNPKETITLVANTLLDKFKELSVRKEVTPRDLDVLNKLGRTMLQTAGAIQDRDVQAVQINFGGQELESMGLYQLEKLREEIEKKINSKWSNIQDKYPLPPLPNKEGSN